VTKGDLALTAQVVAAISAAIAAFFAARATSQVRRAADYNRRVKASEHLKLIHRLITDLVVTAHTDPAATFGPQMRLRAELAVAYGTPLPKCLELVDKWYGETITVEELDKIASAAQAEVEAAHKVVWEGRIVSTHVYTSGTPIHGPSGSSQNGHPGQ
jgi:hypothetical protein